MPRFRPPERRVAVALATAACMALAACATVSDQDRAWIETDGEAHVVALGCPPTTPFSPKSGELAGDRELSITSWNIHRNADAGWEEDLARFARSSDILLLQEATLTVALRERLAAAGRPWTHADAWAFDGINNGVLTAASALPSTACVLRAAEPILTLPKSALVAWYRIAGRPDALAVANMHAVNFTLDLTAYQEQLDAVVAVLATHRGPMIFAGDFNTWSPVRVKALVDTAARVGLVEAAPRRGERTQFLGMPADYLFVRGLAVDDVWVETVDSSDHAPIRAKLRLPPP